MADLSSKISGMDYAEEVAVLRREVGPLVGDDGHLSFDVLQGKMTVRASSNPIEETDVIDTVYRTGMRAERWQESSVSLSGKRWRAWDG